MRAEPWAVLQEHGSLAVRNAHIFKFFVFGGIEAVAFDESCFDNRLFNYFAGLAQAEQFFDFNAVQRRDDRAGAYRHAFGNDGFSHGGTAGKPAAAAVGAGQKFEGLFDLRIDLNFEFNRGIRENGSENEAEHAKNENS